MSNDWMKTKHFFSDTKTFTGFSGATAYEIRNNKGENVGEFQAVTWSGPNYLGHYGGSIVLLEKKEGFVNDDLTLCLDWCPHPLYDEPKTSSGYTVTGVVLFHPEATARPLEDDKVEVGKAYLFRAVEVIPYKNKLS